MDWIASRFTRLALGCLIMVLFGCASTPQTRFFVLSSISGSEKMGNQEAERCFAIGIGAVKIPAYLDQPEIVTRITPNEVRVDEFARWAEPLENNMSRALAENLSSLLCIRSMVIFPGREKTPIDYRVDVQVVHMDGRLAESASLDVSWSIAGGADLKKLPLFTKRSTHEEPTEGGDYGAFVAAQSRNVASLSREIAAAILQLSR
jgi:uncharacterized protein